jgi:hypothetical protein
VQDRKSRNKVDSVCMSLHFGFFSPWSILVYRIYYQRHTINWHLAPQMLVPVRVSFALATLQLAVMGPQGTKQKIGWIVGGK